MAKEYIEREAALSHPFANGHYDHEHAPEDFILGHESYKEWLEQLPAADVHPVVRGRWIDSELDGVPSHCSECKYPIDRFYKTRYCPNCGAMMDEDMREVDDED